MKTESANRIVSLWEDLLPCLGEPQDSGFIINRDGKPLTERQYTILWKRCMRGLKNLGFPTTFTAHQLRHTYATVAANSGAVPLKVLQGILGHANFQTTMNTYEGFDIHKLQESSRDLGRKYAEIGRKKLQGIYRFQNAENPCGTGVFGLSNSLISTEKLQKTGQ